MSDEKIEKFINEVIKPYFRNQKELTQDELLDIIFEKEEQFTATLNDEQKIQFKKLWALLDQYYIFGKPITPEKDIQELLKEINN